MQNMSIYRKQYGSKELQNNHNWRLKICTLKLTTTYQCKFAVAFLRFAVRHKKHKSTKTTPDKLNIWCSVSPSSYPRKCILYICSICKLEHIINYIIHLLNIPHLFTISSSNRYSKSRCWFLTIKQFAI
jgi:hypothetical protein